MRCDSTPGKARRGTVEPMVSDEWVLYVDESGDFGEDRFSCVVGLAMREQESGELERRLRAAVESCFPLVPWPPHASRLNIPVSRAAACLLSDGGHEELRARCAPALEALRAARDEAALRGFWGSIRAGRMPAFVDLQLADAWLLVGTPEAYSPLRALSQLQMRRMGQVLCALSSAYGADDVFVVGSVLSGPGATPSQDGYLCCLEGLFGRLLALIDAEGVRQAVRFRVATRHIEDQTLGVRLPLNAKHVLGAARAARACAARLLDAEPGVRCVPLEHQTRYDARVHAGVVLADFLANRVYRVLRASGLSWHWPKLEDEVRHRTGLAPATRARRFDTVLPALAFEGSLQDWLMSGRVAGQPLPIGSPRWAEEQARRWAEAAGER